MLTDYSNRRIDSADVVRPIDPRLVAYAARCGADADQLALDGVQMVPCDCRMAHCPGTRAKWPNE